MLAGDPAQGYPDWRSKLDECGRWYYWHIDPTTGRQSTSTWTSPHELWQQEWKRQREAEAAATLAAAVAVIARIERDAVQEATYRKKVTYEKWQADRLTF